MKVMTKNKKKLKL